MMIVRIVLIGVMLCVSGCTLDRLHALSPGPVEVYAKQHGRLAPQAIAVLMPWFAGHEEVLTHLRVRVLSHGEAKITALLGMPAIVVLGEIWEVIPGLLDADGVVRGRTFSWAQPKGIALYAHEAYHVQQFLADPAGFIWDVVQGICLSIQDGELYAHQYFPYEVEAIAFERQVRAILEAHQ